MKHNYPRARSFPGPGFSAGPCLFKDTMQLAAYARNQFGLGHAAMQVNEGLVLQMVEDLKRGYDLSTMTVGLLGMAFKAEIDDKVYEVLNDDQGKRLRRMVALSLSPQP